MDDLGPVLGAMRRLGEVLEERMVNDGISPTRVVKKITAGYTLFNGRFRFWHLIPPFSGDGRS